MARTLLSAANVKRSWQELGPEQTQAAKLTGWMPAQSWHKLDLCDSDVRISTLATVAHVLKGRIEDLLIVVSGESRGAARYGRRGK